MSDKPKLTPEQESLLGGPNDWENPLWIQAYRRRHYLLHRDELIRKQVEYGKAHQNHINARLRKRYSEDEEFRHRTLKNNRDKYSADAEHKRELMRARQGTREYKDKAAARLRRRRHDDLIFGMFSRVRLRVYLALRDVASGKRVNKNNRTHELVGCGPKELFDHITRLFEPGMSWERREKFHIDHCFPCAFFDLRDPQEQRACFSWKNLRPAWNVENLRKNDLVIIDGKTMPAREARNNLIAQGYDISKIIADIPGPIVLGPKYFSQELFDHAERLRRA